jgi:hypothetical protein
MNGRFSPRRRERLLNVAEFRRPSLPAFLSTSENTAPSTEPDSRVEAAKMMSTGPFLHPLDYPPNNTRSMKPSRLLFPTIALLAFFSASAFAKKYTPASFRAELTLTMANKKGPAAYNKAATFLQRALADRRNKKYARTFALFTQNSLKGSVVRIPLRGVAANTLTKGLIAGYFAGRPFDLYDPSFNQALKIFLRSLPLSQKTQPVSQRIYNTLKTYSARRGVSQLDVFVYYQTIDVSNRLPQPVS